jgi:ATPase subunit of ABC transporter with duplicated ATPase domains
MGEVMEAQAKLEAMYAAYAEENADFDKLAEEQARLEAIIAASGSRHRAPARPGRRRAAPAAVGRHNRSRLSGGEKRRVALCKLLLSRPDMLLLDEPTNHLDAESVEWLEQFLTRFPGTVVAVTHDRYFLDNAAEWILELDRGQGIPWKGNYSNWLEQKEARLETEAKQEDAPHEGHEAGARMGAQQPQGAPGQEQGPSRTLQRAVGNRLPEAQRDARNLHPGRRAPGRQGGRVHMRSARASATAC